MLEESPNPNDQQVTRAVLHISGNITGLSLGVLTGLVVFVATIWLVIKGGPQVGKHLQLLSQYYIGYTVTWAGAFVGLFYGFLTGYVGGWLVAWMYNLIVNIRNR